MKQGLKNFAQIKTVIINLLSFFSKMPFYCYFLFQLLVVPSDGLYYRVIDDEYTLACVKPAPGDVSNNIINSLSILSAPIPHLQILHLVLSFNMHFLKELVERSC